MKVILNTVLLRIGIDMGCYCGIYGPLFKDGTFEYLPIPDFPDNVDNRKYGEYLGNSGKPLVDYFPESYRSKVKDLSIHFDPEFARYTYGDPTTPKQSLARLVKGDLLAFYCGLVGFPQSDVPTPPALYLMGYFEVTEAGHARRFGQIAIQDLFKSNFHVLHPGDDFGRLVLVKGGKRSRMLKKAYKISDLGKDRRGKGLFVLSKKLEHTFGKFTDLNAIQRSNPRWVDQSFVGKAADFIRHLD